MSGKLAGNAAGARAKAMYGKRLTNEQYRELAAAHTIGEVVTYLRQHTTYATVLTDVNSAAVHRGALEQILRRKAATELDRLYGYDTRIDELVGMYHRQQTEIHWILRWLRAKIRGDDQTWFLSAMTTAIQSALDPVRMNDCLTIADLERELQDTPYAKSLHPFAEGPLPTVTALETVLVRDRNDRLLRTLSAMGEDTVGLQTLLDTLTDAQNFCRIWRLKVYFHASPVFIREQLLPYGRNISSKIWDAMIEAKTAQETAALFWNTPFGRQMPPPMRDDFDMLPERLVFVKAQHAMYFSGDPLIICMAYAMLTEIELHNLIHIVEGIRYELPATAILSFMISDHQKGA